MKIFMKKLIWCRFIFKFEWSEDEGPRWWVGTYMIDTLFREILKVYGKKICMWRFHRRAEQDDNGHQLTLMCYTTERVGRRIELHISKSKVIRTLSGGSFLRSYRVNFSGETISSTSDGKWDEVMRNAWPFFIQGVCESVLVMLERLHIESSYSDIPRDLLTDEWIESYYGVIHKRLVELWERQGSHAFFHHVGGVFGYAPVYVRF